MAQIRLHTKPRLHICASKAARCRCQFTTALKCALPIRVAAIITRQTLSLVTGFTGLLSTAPQKAGLYVY